VSLTSEQAAAFRAGGGFAAQDSNLMLVGFALTLALVFAAWALGSGYSGWARDQLSKGQFQMLIFKVVLIYVLLTYLLLH
jgi:integrating conjugative element protein (TIGR03758 family)